MKLYYSATSPYVRKCLVSAHELGLRERIELLPAAPHPVNRDRALIVCNPLGKVPTLVTDDGTVLYDSHVICEYLNALGDGRLLPEASARWPVYRDQALADGLLDAAVLVRYETFARPEAGCALGYLDFRFASLGWQDTYPKTAAWFAGFGARPSMMATRPPG